MEASESQKTEEEETPEKDNEDTHMEQDNNKHRRSTAPNTDEVVTVTIEGEPVLDPFDCRLYNTALDAMYARIESKSAPAKILVQFTLEDGGVVDTETMEERLQKELYSKSQEPRRR